VERQQVRLLGDLVDQLEDRAYPLTPLAERHAASGDRLDACLHLGGCSRTITAAV
jgi:hypothetical protein